MSNDTTTITDNPESSPLNFFWLGFCLYSIAFVFPSKTQWFVYTLQVIQLVGMVIFASASFKLISWRTVNPYVKSVLIMTLLWYFVIICNGFNLNFEFIKRLLVYSNDGLFMYLIPLILLFPLKVKYFRKIIVVILVSGLFFIIGSIRVWDVLMYAVTGIRNATGAVDWLVLCLAIPCGFILLTYLYNSKKVNIMAVVVMLLALYFTIVRARRGLSFVIATMLLSAFIMQLIYNKDKLFKFVLSAMAIFLLVGGTAVFYAVERNGFFGNLNSRMDEDTRKGVERAFYNDMSPKDWIIGKGIDGYYYCPNIDEGYRITVYRNTIETGYLQVIFRGGIISLFLFALFALPAVFKGYFASKNMLCKAASTWILLFLLYSYPITINWFILSYVIIWISIGICFNKEIRDMTDEEVYKEWNS